MSAPVTPLHAVEDAEGEKPTRKPSTRELAEQIAAQESYAAGGAQLYVFRDGYYRPGEHHLQQRIVELLGHKWSRRNAQEIVAFLHVIAPGLWERPPLDVINTRSGLLDVETRELKPHTPEHLSPVQIAAAYDPDARCPATEAFLQSTIPDLIPLFMEIVGYTMTPDNSLQQAMMFIGQGGTGKSTATELISALLGRANVSTVALHQLEENQWASADMYGVLANIFSDLPAHALKSSSIFKSITGGDYIRGERKHRDAFTFKPYARLIFSANTAPPTADSSDAFFDRWLILPFTHKHRGAKHCDRRIIDKLTTPAELSGLLNHALTGLQRLHTQGTFTRIAASEKAAERFRIDADSAAGFFEECCALDREARIAKANLFKGYVAWCEANNRRPLAAQRFNARLRELHAGQLDEVSSKGTDYWLGVAHQEQRP
jgi:putative DNA primase/helicase